MILQREAYLNEYKGNLFEFLVAQSLARYFNIENSFQEDLPSDLEIMLRHYQTELLQKDKELYRALPQLALEVKNKLVPLLPFPPLQIALVGKKGAVPGQISEKEADFLLLSKDQSLPISLKLCKSGAWVNTKSGGMKSFIANYFAHHPMATIWQEQFNRSIECSFKALAQHFYELADLGFTERFDERWTDAGLSSLPGELPKEFADQVHRHYSYLADELYRIFLHLSEDPLQFAQGLAPMVGMGEKNIWQVTCFHRHDSHNRYLLADVFVSGQEELIRPLHTAKLIPRRDGLSSFEIQFGPFSLQVRIKPMNVFTSPSYKINCSLKHRARHENSIADSI